jgi:anti-sigma factor RsiW
MTAQFACADIRLRLLDYQRGTLVADEHDAVRAHLDACSACAHEDVAEATLSHVLERRLPQHPAPIALKRRLGAWWATASEPTLPAGRRRRVGAGMAAAAVAVLALLTTVALLDWAGPGSGSAPPLAEEAVNDHLRIMDPRRSLEVVSGDIHEVRPWFAGRLDFSPIVPFPGDREFPLRGGAIEQFLDRKAAVLVYGRRRHTASLLVFRAAGLQWPQRGLEPLGAYRAAVASVRGFNVLLWRAEDLGYALASDLAPDELRELALRLAAAQPRPAPSRP